MQHLTTDLKQETASNDEFKHASTKNHSWAPFAANFAYLTDKASLFLSFFSLNIRGFVTDKFDQSLYKL